MLMNKENPDIHSVDSRENLTAGWTENIHQFIIVWMFILMEYLKQRSRKWTLLFQMCAREQQQRRVEKACFDSSRIWLKSIFPLSLLAVECGVKFSELWVFFAWKSRKSRTATVKWNIYFRAPKWRKLLNILWFFFRHIFHEHAAQW